MIKMRVEKRRVFVSGASCLGIKHESYGISKKNRSFVCLRRVFGLVCSLQTGYEGSEMKESKGGDLIDCSLFVFILRWRMLKPGLRNPI